VGTAHSTLQNRLNSFKNTRASAFVAFAAGLGRHEKSLPTHSPTGWIDTIDDAIGQALIAAHGA
jgi:hypothetical protein